MQSTQSPSNLVNQVVQQQRIISQLRNENRELKDNEILLKKKIQELEQVQHDTQSRQIRVRKNIFSEQSSPIRLVQKEVMDDEMRSIQLAFDLQRQDENQFNERLKMMQSQQNPDDMDYEQLQDLQEKMGYVSKGFKSTQIETIMKKHLMHIQSEHDCTICFSNATEIQLPCMHQFHQECLSQWFTQERTCPVCKQEMIIELSQF